MVNRHFTLLIVPGESGKSLRWRVSQRTFFYSMLIGLLLTLCSVFLAIHYVQLLTESKELEILRSKSKHLSHQLQTAKRKIDEIDVRLLELDRMDKKIRALTSLSDESRGLAMDPLPEPNTYSKTRITPPRSLASSFSGLNLDIDAAIMASKFDMLDSSSRKQGKSLSNLLVYIRKQKSLLSITPSIWPARGWVSSRFGARVDPFTGRHTMHHGIDIAARLGSKIVAPANAIVRFVGINGSYGRLVVLDHGNGVLTHYGHLNDTFVRIGDEVSRGQRIAEVGNSGKSTGPHLHYEVRRNGVPVDPRRYILY